MAEAEPAVVLSNLSVSFYCGMTFLGFFLLLLLYGFLRDMVKEYGGLVEEPIFKLHYRVPAPFPPLSAVPSLTGRGLSWRIGTVGSRPSSTASPSPPASPRRPRPTSAAASSPRRPFSCPSPALVPCLPSLLLLSRQVIGAERDRRNSEGVFVEATLPALAPAVVVPASASPPRRSYTVIQHVIAGRAHANALILV